MRLKIPKAFRALTEVNARYYGFHGGRGAAKSRSAATYAIIASAAQKLRILCCREIQRSIKESIKATLDGEIVNARLQDMFVSTQARIGNTEGSEFFFEGLRTNVTAIQSMSDIDLCIVEEAQSISQRSLEVLIPTIRKPGSKIVFLWNPRSPKDPVDRMFRGEGSHVLFEKGGFLPEEYDQWAYVREVNYADNSFFPDVLRAEMERDKARDVDKYKHIWLGEYELRSNAQVFKNWRVDVMEVPKSSRPYFGADWGFSVDPSVLVRVFVFPSIRVLYIEAEVSRVGVEIDKTPALFDEMAAGEDDPWHPRKWPIRADSARPETISYMERHGYPKIQRARKGPGSVEEGVEFMKTYDIVVHPNCKRVIDEMTHYSYEVDKITDEVLPVLADENNNTIDACRYAVEELRRGVSLTAYPVVVTAPRHHFGDHPGG